MNSKNVVVVVMGLPGLSVSTGGARMMLIRHFDSDHYDPNLNLQFPI